MQDANLSKGCAVASQLCSQLLLGVLQGLQAHTLSCHVLNIVPHLFLQETTPAQTQLQSDVLDIVPHLFLLKSTRGKAQLYY